MLIIRREQLAVFRARDHQRFIEDTLQSLPEVFPGDPRVQDEHTMRELIEDGIARAARHGLTATREVSLYVFLLHEFGPDFETRGETRWMGAILRSTDKRPSEKLDLIYTRLELAQARQEGP
jgi:hypothetical protein